MQTKLYRLAALAGLLCSLILLVNAGRRGGILPDAAFAHAIAPLAEAAGLVAVTGFYFWQQPGFGRLGLLGYGLNFFGLAGLVGAEFIINLIFPKLSTVQVNALLAGLTGVEFKVVSIVFLSGVLLFGAALLRVGRLPRIAVGLYVLGCIPIGLRGVLPSATLIPGLVITAAAIAWLSLPLLRGPRV
ncbi:MAG TPA: hypothetical protein VFN97_10750 [Actinospica sp.]|nr:hypothetical protein [Actinospica sp.]